MVGLITLFVTLLCTHFLLDFAIQGDFVAKYKARIVDEKENVFWKWVLTAHAASHTLPVLILTQSVLLGLLMFTSHFVIDFLKCEQKINFNQDQTLHILVIAAITAVSTLI
jgi:hypothetical protein